MVPGVKLSDLFQLVNTSNVRYKSAGRPVQHPGNVVLVHSKAALEVGEQRADGRAVEMEKEQHAGKEQNHLPH